MGIMVGKRARAALVAAGALVLALAGCAGHAARRAETPSPGERPVVYASFYPVADLTRRVVGDRMEVRSIIKAGQEPHDFELQTSDMAEVSKADLVVYNGAGMEGFIDDLKDNMGGDERFLDLSQGLTLLQSKDAAEGDHSSVNPHTWLSIKNAQHELARIYERVCQMDPAGADEYKANYEKSASELRELDQKFETELSKVPADKRYFVVSHAAFNYLANDYGLNQVAVTGISPEDEPSAAQLATIADFVKQHSISTIFFEGKATPKVAETLAKNTGTKTSTLHTMESLTEEEMSRGYVALMEQNLDALMESFNA